MQKNLIILMIMLATIIAVPMVAMAQGPSTSDGTIDTTQDEAAPIDGGLTLLVAAGVGYGAKKLKERRKNLADKGVRDARC